jgi:hypothetical protein
VCSIVGERSRNTARARQLAVGEPADLLTAEESLAVEDLVGLRACGIDGNARRPDPEEGQRPLRPPTVEGLSNPGGLVRRQTNAGIIDISPHSTSGVEPGLLVAAGDGGGEADEDVASVDRRRRVVARGSHGGRDGDRN